MKNNFKRYKSHLIFRGWFFVKSIVVLTYLPLSLELYYG